MPRTIGLHALDERRTVPQPRQVEAEIRIGQVALAQADPGHRQFARRAAEGHRSRQPLLRRLAREPFDQPAFDCGRRIARDAWKFHAPSLAENSGPAGVTAPLLNRMPAALKKRNFEI